MKFVSSSCWDPRADEVCSSDSPSNGFSRVSLWRNFCWKRCVAAPSSSQLFSSNHIYTWLRFVVGMKWRSELIFTTLHTWRHFHLQAITLANSFSMLQVIFFVRTNSCFHLAAVKKKLKKMFSLGIAAAFPVQEIEIRYCVVPTHVTVWILSLSQERCYPV